MKMTKHKGAKRDAGLMGVKPGIEQSTAEAKKYTLLMRLNWMKIETGRKESLEIQLRGEKLFSYRVYLVVETIFPVYLADPWGSSGRFLVSTYMPRSSYFSLGLDSTSLLLLSLLLLFLEGFFLSLFHQTVFKGSSLETMPLWALFLELSDYCSLPRAIEAIGWDTVSLPRSSFTLFYIGDLGCLPEGCWKIVRLTWSPLNALPAAWRLDPGYRSGITFT